MTPRPSSGRVAMHPLLLVCRSAQDFALDFFGEPYRYVYSFSGFRASILTPICFRLSYNSFIDHNPDDNWQHISSICINPSSDTFFFPYHEFCGHFLDNHKLLRGSQPVIQPCLRSTVQSLAMGTSNSRCSSNAQRTLSHITSTPTIIGLTALPTYWPVQSKKSLQSLSGSF